MMPAKTAIPIPILRIEARLTAFSWAKLSAVTSGSL
jgi:hypothetical protein